MHLFYYLLVATIISGCQSQAGRPAISPSSKSETVLHKIASQAIEYVDSADMETEYCFLFDAGRPSFDNRFIVYNLQGDTIMSRGKAAHGRCNQDCWREENIPMCRVVDVHRLVNTGSVHLIMAVMVPAYKLYGLDSTNNNAFNRFVVLHAHDCVPEPSSAIYTIMSE